MNADQLAKQQADAMARQQRVNNAHATAQAMVGTASPSANDRKTPSRPTRQPVKQTNVIADALGLTAMFTDFRKGQFEKDKAEGKNASVAKINQEKKFDAEAADEHSWGDVPLCAGPEDLLQEHGLGQGIMWYYKFMHFIIGYNFVLLLIALISFIPHIVTGPNYDGGQGTRFPGAFYLSTYTEKSYAPFVLSVTLMLILTFSLGPTYRYYVKRWYAKQREARDAAAAGDQNVNWIEDEFEGQYGRAQFDYVDENAVDRIEYDPPTNTRFNRWGVGLSIFLMTVVLGVSGIVTFYMQRAARESGGNALASFCIAVFVAGLGFAWEYLCYLLTKIEKWAYWTDYWRSTTVKVLLFKILNIFTVFLVKRIEYQADVSEDDCQLRDLGNQFLLLIAFNTLATFANLGYVLFFTDKEAERTPDGPREFILATEYVEIVYRQFLLGLGFLVMPMIVLFGLAANIIEYWLDKYRMLRVCNKPGQTKSAFSGVLAFYFFLSALFILLSFPNGAVFVLAGSYGLSDDPTCYIYQ